MRGGSTGRPLGPPFSRVLLAGGGHAHLELVRSAAEFRAARIALTLVDPGDFQYSGGASGVLGGSMAPQHNRVDLSDLCRRFDVAYRRDRVVGVDLGVGAGVARLGDGAVLAFDRISFNIGSQCRVDGLSVPSDAARAKPIAGLAALRDGLISADRETRVLVLGGGATGVELAGNLARLSRSAARAVCVTLVAGSPRLLPGLPARAGRLAAVSLARAGVNLRCGRRVTGFEAGHARLATGEAVAFDRLLLATGLEAPSSIAGLPAAAGAQSLGGGIAVDHTLCMPGAPHVFAVGDCAAIEDWNLPRLGVHGVRAAPVLKHNLVASLGGAALETYRPQRLALSILDLGDDTGLMTYGRLVFRSRAMLRWKRRIDRRFLDRYRAV